jgi:CBS domain-containing protein
VRRGAIVPPRRPEGIRWLRSDGTPNFSDRVHKHPGDAKLLARRPVYTTTKTATILMAAEEMTRHNVRALPVVVPNVEKLEGMVTVMDLVNYFGGGELYNIVKNRHGGNIYSALLKEHVESIMNPNPVYVTIYDKLPKILEVMVLKGVGVVPVVMEDGTIWGIITEHDLVQELVEKKVGVKVADVMTKEVITLPATATIREAAETMVKYGIRRVPLLENENKVWGMVTAKDIVRFFGSHDVFRYVEGNSFEEALRAPVKLVVAPGYYTISPDADVGDAATLMAEKGTSSLLVVEDGRLVGIITERDVLYAVAAQRPQAQAAGGQ